MINVDHAIRSLVAAVSSALLLALLPGGVVAALETGEYNIWQFDGDADCTGSSNGTIETCEFVEAVETAVANGRDLYLPEETYAIDSSADFSTLDITSPIRIYGQGAERTILDGSLSGGGEQSSTLFSVQAAFALESLTVRDWHAGIIRTDEASGDIEGLEVRRVHFENTGFSHDSSGSSVKLIDVRGEPTHALENVYVVGCRSENSSGLVSLDNENVEKVFIQDNVIVSALSSAIVVGDSGSYTDQDDMREYVITGNVIDGIDGGEAVTYGIQTQGREVLIAGNVVKNLTLDGSTTTSVHGIYIKALQAKILGNSIVDVYDSAATGDSSGITVKGSERVSPTTPQGYGVIIADNHIVNSNGNGFGITLHNEDVLIHGNVIDGLEQAIKGYGGSSNVSIHDNHIFDTQGERAISLAVGEEGYRIVDNVIDGVTYTGQTGEIVAIRFTNNATTGAATDIVVRGNTIKNVTGGGKQIGVMIQHASTMNDVVIADNHFSGLTDGVYLASTYQTSGSPLNGLVVERNFFDVTGEELRNLELTAGNVWVRANRGYASLALELDTTTTPTVRIWDEGLYQFDNSSATTVDDFDDGVDGMVIHVLGDDYTTIEHGAGKIETRSGSDITPYTTGLRTFRQIAGTWHEQ